MWSLDGVLRYVPMSALYDGQHYLIENYRNTEFTPASLALLQSQPAPAASLRVLGLGVSKPHTGFPALPGVAEELRAIVNGGSEKGLMPGKVLLDEAFTSESMQSALREGYPIVHMAGHFIFKPDNAPDSFLLLGDGSRLTVDQLRTLPNLFSGVELLTLSAGNTALTAKGSNGREVGAFAYVAQQLGARSVMATLWSVSDMGSAVLMREFFRQLREGQSKAEALRRAQLALLRGGAQAGVTGANDQRAEQASGASDNPGAQPFKADPRKPYAHPYYWAPFILIGNWR